MTDAHKAALAKGRAESNAVRRYLEALGTGTFRPGRRGSKASMERRLGALERAMATADPMSRLHLAQEAENLRSRLAEMEARGELAELEREFVRVARSYGERKGISYGTWRAVGVGAGVLRKAGIARTRS